MKQEVKSVKKLFLGMFGLIFGAIVVFFIARCDYSISVDIKQVANEADFYISIPLLLR